MAFLDHEEASRFELERRARKVWNQNNCSLRFSPVDVLLGPTRKTKPKLGCTEAVPCDLEKERKFANTESYGA